MQGLRRFAFIVGVLADGMAHGAQIFFEQSFIRMKDVNPVNPQEGKNHQRCNDHASGC
jgi:hypothetical protein